MAALGKIREKSGLLILVIGVALAAFILGDFFRSTGSSGGGGLYIGKVSGEDILRENFEIKVDEGLENWKSQNQNSILTQTIIGQVRSQIWDQYIRELIMDNEFKKLGIDISDDEFFELLQGVNVHPEISNVAAFQDPNTRQFDRTRVLGYLKQIDQDQTGESKKRWLGFQSYLINLIKTSKYNALVDKAMYITSEEVNNDLNSANQSVNFNYVSIPFSSIVDSILTPTKKELKDYYNKNKEDDFQQKSSKDVDYIVFSVVPSNDDDVNTKESINELIDDFRNEDDYQLMAKRNSDNTNAKFFFSKRNELLDKNWNDLFDEDVNTVYGPYLLRPGVYRLAKLVALQNRPDSVKARHILISPTPTMNLDSVNSLLNDLKLLVEKGEADFGVLAEKYSEDKGSAIKGGDLDWFTEGMMVDEFNEICFTSNKGELSIVNTQFGTHLIQVTNLSKKVKKAKIAYIDRNVEPSTETFNNYYSSAAQFAGKILNESIPFDSLVEKQNLVKRSDSKVTEDKQAIVGLPNSREMVRWLNNAKVGTVSEVFQFDNSFVVAYITKEYIEGDIPFEEIEPQLSALVLKEKKATKISEDTKITDLNTIASFHSTSVTNNQKITFSSLNIPGIGYEPKLIGKIFGLKVGDIAGPIVGENAVYFVEVTNVDKEKSSGDFMQQKSKLEKQVSSYAKASAYNALKLDAKVEDNRSDFY